MVGMILSLVTPMIRTAITTAIPHEVGTFINIISIIVYFFEVAYVVEHRTSIHHCKLPGMLFYTIHVTI